VLREADNSMVLRGAIFVLSRFSGTKIQLHLSDPLFQAPRLPHPALLVTTPHDHQTLTETGALRTRQARPAQFPSFSSGQEPLPFEGYSPRIFITHRSSSGVGSTMRAQRNNFP
jgi:hypothetical protein